MKPYELRRQQPPAHLPEELQEDIRKSLPTSPQAAFDMAASRNMHELSEPREPVFPLREYT